MSQRGLRARAAYGPEAFGPGGPMGQGGYEPGGPMGMGGLWARGAYGPGGPMGQGGPWGVHEVIAANSHSENSKRQSPIVRIQSNTEVSY